MTVGSRSEGAPLPVTHRAVLAIAVPMMLANLSTPLLGLVDTGVIGRLGQAHLIGAVAVGSLFFSFLFWGFGFLKMGTIGLTAQAQGALDRVEERVVLARAALLALAIGAFCVLLRAPLADALFALMDASPAVEEAARTYVAVRIWSAPMAFLNFVLLGWFLGLGRARVALGLQVLLNLANMALNLWLVLGLGMGVTGLALGTVLAETLAVGVGAVLAGRQLGWHWNTPRARLLDGAAFRRMMAVNRDIMIRTLALVFAFAFFTRQGAQGGDVILAANAILMNLFLFAGHFLDGAAAAAEQLGGRSVGARDPAGLRRTMRLTVLWGYMLAAALALVYWIAGPAIIALLTTAEDVRAQAQGDLWWAILTPLAGTLAFQLDGLFIGATWTGAMRDMMLASLLAYLGLWWLLTGPLDWGNAGLWTALNAFLLVRGLTLLWRYPIEEARTFPSMVPAPRPV